jgi:fumarylacetoacetate (FAA) hydrolase family protein
MISRDPEDLVQQTIGSVHQYHDGFVLFLGTMFAPKGSRYPGTGFYPQNGRRGHHRERETWQADEQNAPE